MNIYSFVRTAKPKTLGESKVIYEEHVLEKRDMLYFFDETKVPKSYYDVALRLLRQVEDISNIALNVGDVVVVHKVDYPWLTVNKGQRLTVTGTEFEPGFVYPTQRMSLACTLLNSPMTVWLRDVREVWRDGFLFYDLSRIPR